jgi:hypothetical protein
LQQLDENTATTEVAGLIRTTCRKLFTPPLRKPARLLGVAPRDKALAILTAYATLALPRIRYQRMNGWAKVP